MLAKLKCVHGMCCKKENKLIGISWKLDTLHTLRSLALLRWQLEIQKVKLCHHRHCWLLLELCRKRRQFLLESIHFLLVLQWSVQCHKLWWSGRHHSLNLIIEEFFITSNPWSKFSPVLTINFKGIIYFDISRGIFTEAIKHVQEIIKRHITWSIVRENLTNSSLKRIFLPWQEEIYEVRCSNID